MSHQDWPHYGVLLAGAAVFVVIRYLIERHFTR